MKKIIFFTILICFLATVTIAGGIYFQKKDQFAELEKAGMEFLAEGLEDELALGTSKTASDSTAVENQGNDTGPVGTAPEKNSFRPQGQTGKPSITSIRPMTNQDKLAVAKIILSKVPVDELNLFKEMAKGGITAEEKKKAKNILKSRLSQDDVDTLKEIVRKYKM